MYDNEEEIRRKRRILFIIIGIVAFLILVLILILISRATKKETPKVIDGNLECGLIVTKGTANSQGVYTSEVLVEFDESKLKMVSPDYTLVKKKIGIRDSNNNKETYLATTSAHYVLHGYVQDSAGNRGTCDLEFDVNISTPTCELEIQKGTLGENEWYTSDVEIGFKSMGTGSDTASIVKYYIEKDVINVDTSEVIRQDQPAESIATYVFKDDMSADFTGYVIDSNGTEGTCKITVKKDATLPECSLKVTKGTLDSKGQYTDNPVIEFNEVKDSVSDIAAKGIGIAENYTEASYTVEKEGTTVVNGYVKDNAGNSGSCALEIKRPTKQAPTCTLSPKGGSYTGGLEITVNPSAVSPATVTSYGISTKATLNNNKTYKITSAGTYTIYGMVKDSNGLTGTCSETYKITGENPQPTGDLLASVVKVGDFVNYDAGNWTSTAAVPTRNGQFGGYNSGQSKNSSVKCFASQETTGTPKNGWVVLSVANDKVTLVHAGTPECYYHGTDASASTAISKINARASGYINSKYAESARILNCGDNGVNCVNGTKLTTPYVAESNYYVHITNTHYFLPTAKSSNVLWGVSYSGTVRGYSEHSFGIRPVVVLKSDVRTTGKQNNTWVLK